MKSINRRRLSLIALMAANCGLFSFCVLNSDCVFAAVRSDSSCAGCPADYAKGVSAYASGNYAAVIRYMQSAQHDQPTRTDALLYEARAFLQLQQSSQAETAARNYVALHPGSADAHFLLGYAYFRESRPKRSLVEYTAGARLHPPDADALAVVALDYVLLHDYTDADRWLTQATHMAPANAQYWYYLGRARYNENRFQEAVDAFRECLKLAAHNAKALNNLGLAHQGLGQMPKAIQDFQTAIRYQAMQGKPDAQPYLDLGDLLLSQGKLKQATVLLEKSAEMAPRNPKVHEELGKAYEQANLLRQAQVELQKAVALAPQISSLHFELGRVYKKEGLNKSAQQEFSKCAAINGSQSTDNAETPNPDGRG